ncbi:MAG: histidine kinase [Sediminibacterium sp.]|nr:MAG: putative signal transduction histidine [Chitinophagaceae bacterium]MDP1842181.1 histidine kinase [Sediminibacterium sp.]TXT34271.1 MAG: putative signal transduction histidine kinase [Chitinophagaceae bacterium]
MDAQEARIYLAVIISVTLIGVILSYLAILIIRQQRKNLELQKMAALAEIASMEKERARIAADLHDELGPILSVIKFRIDGAATQPNAVKEELVMASKQIDQVIEKLRTISNDLLPVVLQRKGPISAIEVLIEQLNVQNGPIIDIIYPAHLIINEDHGIQIYRIVFEAINNCIKYAAATKMQIIFKEEKKQLKLICQDNGKGMEIPEPFQQNGGRGLVSMKNRTALMNGIFTIESEIGKGTLLQFEIPL